MVSEFVIYPSWEFDISGCLMIAAYAVILEAVRGDIAPLLQGKSTPDSVYYSREFANLRFQLEHGETDIIVDQEKAFFQSICRALPLDRHSLFEWTKTSEGKILFHDLFEPRGGRWP
jgi:hypothetical protein